jgi:hypothetical protein
MPIFGIGKIKTVNDENKKYLKIYHDNLNNHGIEIKDDAGNTIYDMPESINLELSINKDCVMMNCDTMKKVIEKLKKELDKSTLSSELQLHKSTFDDVKIGLFKNEKVTKTEIEITNPIAVIRTIIKTIVEVNKTIKVGDNSDNSNIKNNFMNLYVLLKRIYSKLIAFTHKSFHLYKEAQIYNDMIKKINKLDQKHIDEICKTNIKVLRKIYTNINNLLLIRSGIIDLTLDREDEQLSIMIPAKIDPTKSKRWFHLPITTINIGEKTFSYINSNNKTETKKFSKICAINNCINAQGKNISDKIYKLLPNITNCDEIKTANISENKNATTEDKLNEADSDKRAAQESLIANYKTKLNKQINQIEKIEKKIVVRLSRLTRKDQIKFYEELDEVKKKAKYLPNEYITYFIELAKYLKDPIKTPKPGGVATPSSSPGGVVATPSSSPGGVATPSSSPGGVVATPSSSPGGVATPSSSPGGVATPSSSPGGVVATPSSPPRRRHPPLPSPPYPPSPPPVKSANKIEFEEKFATLSDEIKKKRILAQVTVYNGTGTPVPEADINNQSLTDDQYQKLIDEINKSP